MAASAVTVRVALAAVPGPASFDVTVLVVTMIAPLAVERACALTGTSHDSPAASVTPEKLKPCGLDPPLPAQVTEPKLDRVILAGKLTLKAIPVNVVAPLGLVIVTSYTVVFAPPATTVDGLKLALNVAGTCADACPTQIRRSASDNQGARSLRQIIGTSRKRSLSKEGIVEIFVDAAFSIAREQILSKGILRT